MTSLSLLAGRTVPQSFSVLYQNYIYEAKKYHLQGFDSALPMKSLLVSDWLILLHSDWLEEAPWMIWAESQV